MLSIHTYTYIYIYIYGSPSRCLRPDGLPGIPFAGVLEAVAFARPGKCFPGMRKPWLSDP